MPAHIDSIYINSIQNESSEPSITNQLLDNITESLINENVIDIKSKNLADSRLDIIVLDVKDVPNIYGINIACIEGIKPFEIENIPVNDGENHPLDQKK